MKRALCLVAMLAMVASASATVRVFVTSSADGYGLENIANAFVPTISTVYSNGVNVNGYDYEDYDTNPGPIRPGTYPPAGAPSGDVTNPVLVDASAGAFAYVWLQYQSEANLSSINGLTVRIQADGTTTPASGLTYNWYLCNNKNNNIGAKRWDGTATPPLYPEWHNNPQTFVAIQAYGLQNKSADLAWNLWKGGTYRMALLGAIAGDASDTKYDIVITNISYASPPNPTTAGGVFQFTPEPASLLLMGLAGLLLRRR